MAGAPVVNVADTRGLQFACQPGCGFCCTANPLVLPHEAPALGSLVVRAEDGTLRIPIKGLACGALGADASCTVYANRPSVCHLYPFQVHAGRRVQVTVSLGCPGVAPAPDAGAALDEGAQEAARLALAQPEAPAMAQRAKETFAEFDRRMKEWGVHATPDQLRAAFLPHLALLAHPESLPAFFAGLDEGDLVLGPKPALAVEALFHADPEGDLTDLLVEAARDGFDEPQTVVWVEADHAWTRVEAREGRVALLRQKGGVDRAAFEADPTDLPTEWDEEASAALQAYLEKLVHRDQTEGAAAWMVDASGYQVTPAAAYGRVLAEAALQVVLRAGLLAAEDKRETVDAALARRAIAAYETAYHSLPTLGSVL